MHDDLEPGVRIQLRRDTTINWATDNPVLMIGETGWDADLRRVKLGDGVTAWNDLPYAADEAADVDTERVRAQTAEAGLQTQIDAIETGELTQGRFVSTDGSYGLPTPTSSGAEFVVVSGVLDDITYDGNPL